MLAAFKRREQHPQYDPFKSDVFSLGMTGLELATFTKPTKCYDMMNYMININEVKERLTRVSSRYYRLDIKI